MLKYFVNYQAWLAEGRHKVQDGQSLAEYGLILALIAVVCITALNLLGGNLSAKINCLATGIKIGVKANANC